MLRDEEFFEEHLRLLAEWLALEAAPRAEPKEPEPSRALVDEFIAGLSGQMEGAW